VQENIIVKVTADIANFTRNISSAGKTLSSIGSGYDTATKKQGSFIRGMSQIASGIGVYAAVSKGIGLISSSLDTAISRYDTLNNFPKVLQRMGFEAEDAQGAINKLSDGIQGLPTTLDSVASTTQRLALMTGDLDGAVDTTLALNNAFLASGSSSADAARGLEQYIQMMAVGKVDMDAWTTLQETMPYALNKTAEAFGYTGESGKAATQELYDALKSGKITFDDFNKQIVNLNEGVGGFAELAQDATDGIRTAWTNMGTDVAKGVTSIIESIDSVLADTPLKSIANIIDQIGDSLYAFLDGIATRIPEFVEYIKNLFSIFQEGGLPSVFNEMLNTASGFTTSIIDIIAENLPTILESGKGILLSIIQGIIEVLPQHMETILQIVEMVADLVIDNLPLILETGTEILLSLIDGITEMLPSLIDTGIQLIEKLIDILIENLPQIIDTGVEMLNAIVDGIIDALPELISAGIDLLNALADTVIDNLPEIIDAGIEILEALIDGIIDALPDLLKTGVKLIKDLASELLAKAPGLLKDVGEAVVEGIWEGIKSLGGWLKRKVSGFFSGIVDWGKKALGINSPSRVIRDEVARWIPAGLVDGINREKNAVIKAAEQMAQWATPDVPDVAIAYSTPSGLRSSLSSAVSGTVDVNMNSTHGLLSQILAELKEQRNIAVNMDGERVGQLVRPHVNEGNAVDALVRRYFD
jgi:tape measure domain-containing protein